MNERIEKRLDDIPIMYKNHYRKAISGKNRPAAIKAFCLECMGWKRTEVHQCDSVACPLYLYRPYK